MDEFLDGQYAVLFSTRRVQNDSHRQMLQIEPITDMEELLQIFRSEYTRALSPEKEACVREIIALSGGHPLSIRIVASTMQSRRISPEKMLSLFKERTANTDGQAMQVSEQVYGRLQQVFSMAELSSGQKYILKNLSCIPVSGITAEEFYDWCGLEDYELLDGLISASWILHDQVTDEVHLHPLVASMMHELLRQDASDIHMLVNSFYEYSVLANHASAQEKQRLLNYGKYMDSLELPDRELRRKICISAGYLWNNMSQNEKSLNSFSEALTLSDSLEDKLHMYFKLSHINILSIQLAKGRELAAEGLLAFEQADPSEITPLAMHYRNELLLRMSESDRNLGDPESAIQYAKEAIAHAEEHPEGNPPAFLGWACFHLAESYLRANDTSAAEEAIKRSLDQFREKKDIWSENFAHDLLGQILRQQCRYEEAIEESLISYDILLQLYGKGGVARNLLFRAYIYRDMGDMENMRNTFLLAKESYLASDRTKNAALIDRLLEDPFADIQVDMT